MRSRYEMMMRDDRAPLAMYQQPPVPAMPHEAPEPSVVQAILRHFWLVILFAALAVGGAMTYLNYAIPLYTSEAKIYIQQVSGIRVLNETLTSTQRSNYLYTQASLITTTPILNMVLETPGIKDLKTFEKVRSNPILYLRDELTAEVGRKDDMISISISSPYAPEAKMIVDATVKAYTDYQNIDKQTNTTSMAGTIKATLDKAQVDRDEIREKLTAFKKAHPSLGLDPANQGALGLILNAYTSARLASIDAQATFGPGHRNVQIAKDKEEKYYSEWQQARDQAIKANTSQADFQLLQVTLADKEAFVKQLQDRFNNLEIEQRAQQIINTVQEMEPARVADYPSSPRKYRVLALAIVGGGLLGAGLALLRDRTDGRMRSVEEIQTVIDIPILGVVPGMSGRRTAVARAMTVHLDPRSVVAEAYRTIRTAVYFGSNNARTKTLLVTSPEPGDGKTTSASNLAIAIAQTGRSVLLLDADFRKPSQHKNLDIKNSIGLSSVLAGTEPLEHAIQRTGVEGLDILPCGPIPGNPSEILNSREFGELIDNLATRYDHILFDSPPVNAVTDARILGAVCDATILVLRADKSTKKSGEQARNGLLAVGARILGTIVNDAPNRKGYETYGGSYYGSADVTPRHSGGNGNGNGYKRLPTPVSDVAD